MTRLALALAAALLFVTPVSADLSTIDEKRSVRVIDGDTIQLAGERIRLRSKAGAIYVPELRSPRCQLELVRAQAAKERLSQIIATPNITIDRRAFDDHGRTVAVIYIDGKDVGALLVREGHASLRKVELEWCRP